MTDQKFAVIQGSSTPTWRALRATLPAGLSEAAIELVRVATSQSRHLARVRAAVEAALAYTEAQMPAASASWHPSDRERERAEVLALLDSAPAITLSVGAAAWAARAAAAIEIELNGCGGSRDCGAAGGLSPSTQRMTWAQSLGSGRHQARDGGAWDSALVSARSSLAPGLALSPQALRDLAVGEMGGPCRAIIADADFAFCAAYCRGRIYQLSSALVESVMAGVDAEPIAGEIAAWDAALSECQQMTDDVAAVVAGHV